MSSLRVDDCTVALGGKINCAVACTNYKTEFNKFGQISQDQSKSVDKIRQNSV